MKRELRLSCPNNLRRDEGRIVPRVQWPLFWLESTLLLPLCLQCRNGKVWSSKFSITQNPPSLLLFMYWYFVLRTSIIFICIFSIKPAILIKIEEILSRMFYINNDALILRPTKLEREYLEIMVPKSISSSVAPLVFALVAFSFVLVVLHRN